MPATQPMTGLPYWRLSSFYFFYFSLLGATAPYFTLYFNHLNLSSARIGELLAVPMLMRCLAPNLWGWLGDHTGRRLAIVRLGAFCTVLGFSGIFFSHAYPWLMLVMALHAFFWHAVLPQFEVLTLAHLRDQVERYSRIRLWGSIGFICAVAGLGWLFDHASLDFYPWVIFSIMLGVMAASWWVPAAQPATQREAAETGFLRQLFAPGVLAFYLGVCLMQLSHGPYYAFFSLYLEELGYGRKLIGALWALGVVAEVLLFLRMPQLLKRFSVRQVLGVSCLLAAVRWLLLGQFAGYLPLLLFAQLLHAATFGSFHAAAIHFLQQHFGPRQQGQGQSLYAALAGTGGALGALYSGYSWRDLGPSWTFTVASVAAALAAFIVWRAFDRLKQTSLT